MEENTQENAEIVGSNAKTVEKVAEPILEKTDSTDAEESVSLDQTEENDNQEDFNSARSRSDTECSDSRTGSEDDDDDASVVLEREEGDGQESTPNRKVDDDEDKRNPQYIPKKGTFYEHDDRTAADEGEEEVKETPEDDKSDKDAGKKKVWSEKEANKWSHDRFNDQEQMPKSRQELIAIYGYDIRNEEGPPRARRRRRYGRGPNKYTRNWEDEDAYSKPTNVSAKPVQRKPRTKPGQEEFPPLNPQDKRSDSKSSERTESDEIGNNSGSKDGKENREVPAKKNDENDDIVDVQQRRDHPKSHAPQNSRKDFRGGRNMQKRNDEQTRASVTNNVRGITKTRGYFKNGGRGTDQTRVRNQRNQKPSSGDEYSDYILSQNFTNKSMNQHQQNVQKIEKDMANMTMQQTGNEGQPSAANNNINNSASYTGSTTTRGGKFGNSGGNRQTSVPPRLQQEQRGSKRYSSLRQRSLPETANFGPQPSYFQTEYTQQPTSQPPQSQAGLLPHPQPSIHSQVTSTTTPQLITVAPSQPLNPIAHQGPPANGAPLMQAPPPQFAQPYAQPPPAFMQPPVAPGVAPFIPQQAPPPQIINYAQPQFTGQFGQFQHQHQHQQFNPVNQGPQPAELYQPQGGITYYSTQNQQVVPRAPPKRVKAAIPIVPPPEHKEPRGRGRLNQAEQESPGGSAPDSSPDNYEQQNCEFAADAPVAIQ